MGVDLLLLTIRLSLITYTWSEWLRFRRPHAWRAVRSLWTSAAALCVIHSAIAFAVHHGFSQRAAYEHTAAQTARVTGLAWGGGLYVNYVFLVWWVADAVWWWAAPASYTARPRAITAVISGLALFMFFNATVVFGDGVDRVLGAAAAVLTITAAASRHRAIDGSGHRAIEIGSSRHRIQRSRDRAMR